MTKLKLAKMTTLKLTDFAAQVQKIAKSVGEDYSCVKVALTTSEWKGEVSFKPEYAAYISGWKWVEAPTMLACLDLITELVGNTERAEVII